MMPVAPNMNVQPWHVDVDLSISRRNAGRRHDAPQNPARAQISQILPFSRLLCLDRRCGHGSMPLRMPIKKGVVPPRAISLPRTFTTYGTCSTLSSICNGVCAHVRRFSANRSLASISAGLRAATWRNARLGQQMLFRFNVRTSASVRGVMTSRMSSAARAEGTTSCRCQKARRVSCPGPHPIGSDHAIDYALITAPKIEIRYCLSNIVCRASIVYENCHAFSLTRNEVDVWHCGLR